MSLVVQQVPLEIIWQVRQQVMYPELSVADMALPDDANGRHLGLFENDGLRSVVSLFTHEKSLQFRKFATLEPYQGKGFGSHLLRHVFALARAEGIGTIWCNARTSALGLYQQLGMQPFGAQWQQHGRLFVKMQVTL